MSTKTGSNNFNIGTPSTQAEKLAFHQNQVIGSYIAPQRNKNIDGVLNDDQDHSIYYSPEYRYGTDDIDEYQQIVVIETGGKLYWGNIPVTS